MRCENILAVVSSVTGLHFLFVCLFVWARLARNARNSLLSSCREIDTTDYIRACTHIFTEIKKGGEMTFIYLLETLKDRSSSTPYTSMKLIEETKRKKKNEENWIILHNIFSSHGYRKKIANENNRLAVCIEISSVTIAESKKRSRKVKWRNETTDGVILESLREIFAIASKDSKVIGEFRGVFFQSFAN